jgi:hypothetical protein
MSSEILSTPSEDLEATADEFLLDNSTHREMIETVISSLQQYDSAMVQESGSGHIWKFRYGSVEVFVRLTGENDDDLFTVWSFVLRLPVKDEPGLTRKLLEMNCTDTFEAHFGLMDDRVVVISQRIVADLSPGEISRAITLVAAVADNNDEALKEAFGGA